MSKMKELYEKVAGDSALQSEISSSSGGCEKSRRGHSGGKTVLLSELSLGIWCAYISATSAIVGKSCSAEFK